MANNRMFLVHDATGQRVHIASHFAAAWQVWIYDTLCDRLNDAFALEAGDGSSEGSTSWHIEYEHHSKHSDPLMPSTTETYQDDDGQWHPGCRP